MRAWLKGIALVAALAAAAVMAQTNGHRAEIVATMSGAAATPAPTPTPTPTDPAPGYSAWFDAAAEVYTDAGGTTPAVADGDPIGNWKSKGGSYGALPMIVPGGFNAPALKLAANGINSLPVVRGTGTGQKLNNGASAGDLSNGSLLGADAGTVFSVVRVPVIDGSWWRSPWGEDANGIGHGLADIGGGDVAAAHVNDGAWKRAEQSITQNVPHILTWHFDGGLLYSGVDDTRTASMASVAAGTQSAAGTLDIVGGIGALGLDGDVAEIIFYPTALTQPDRKITERYLAAKYGITLPY